LKPLPPTDFCRLDSTYGHTLERQYLRPHRIVVLLAELVVLLRWRPVRLAPVSRSEPIIAAANWRDSVENVSLRPPAKPAAWVPHLRMELPEPLEADGDERRARAWRELPSSVSPSSILRRHPAAAKDLESLPPRRPPPLLLRASGGWLVEVAKAVVPTPPAKENVFPITRMPSTVSSSLWCVRIAPPARFGFGLLPPRRPAFLKLGLATRSTSAFFFRPTCA